MMDRNNHMPAVSHIAARSYKANRSRNLVAILAIILTTVMFTTIFTIGFSMLQSMAAMGAAGAGADAQGILIIVSGIVMVLISGYLIIYNIFQISVAQDIRFYGLLKTLGATRAQVGRILLSQAMKLCLIGIPAGLLIGYAIGALIMPIMLVSLGTMAVLSINPAIFIGAALFALVTVLLSCAKPAAIAGKVSPITAMKYVNGDMDRKARKKRTSKHFSLRGMAADNLKRNKKRTATVIISISLGLMLMNSFYVMQNSYDKETYVDRFIRSDLMLTVPAANNDYTEYDGKSGLTQEMVDSMASQPGVTQSGGVHYTETRARINEDVLARLTAYYGEEDSGQSYWVQSDENASRQYADLKRTGETTISVYGMDAFTAPMGDFFVGNYDAEKFATGNYVIALGIADNGEGSVHYAVGDAIEIGGQTYELMGMMDPAQTVSGSVHSPQNTLEIDYAIHTDAFRQSFPNAPIISAFADTRDAAASNAAAAVLQAQYPDISVATRQTYEAQFQSQILAQVIMGYTLGVIMALIGVLNFVNSMLTAIIARKREFAMLESVGMAKPQLKKMLIYEGVHYAAISLAVSVLLSVFVASTIIQETIYTSWVPAYSFSLLPFGIIAPMLIALAVFIPLVCFKGLQKKSLTERLRETGA